MLSILKHPSIVFKLLDAFFFMDILHITNIKPTYITNINAFLFFNVYLESLYSRKILVHEDFTKSHISFVYFIQQNRTLGDIKQNSIEDGSRK